MKNRSTARRHVALPGAPFLPLAASHTLAATIHTQGSIPCVCGGLGQGSRQNMQARRRSSTSEPGW